MNRVAILTLTRFPDIFNRLASTVHLHEPERQRVVVTSGGNYSSEPGTKIAGMNWGYWEAVPGIEPFVFSRNVNRGLAHIGPDHDVLLINDDCVLTMPIVEELQRICESDHTIGILAPQVDGGVGNPDQHVNTKRFGRTYDSDMPVCFVCVFIPARTLAAVGPMDESFTGYGGDDVDYNERVKAVGLRCCITDRVRVSHGYGAGMEFSSSFTRVMGKEEQRRSMQEMNRRAQDKHAGKVAVVIPSSSVPRSLAFETSVAALALPPGSERMRIAGPSAAKNRNDGIRNASGHITHFFFTDDDAGLPPDTVMRLLAHKKPVVAALTCLASPPYLPVIAKGAEIHDGVPHHVWYSWDDLKGQAGLIEVFAGPGSGLLVHRSVLERLGSPWFEMGKYHPEETSEDFFFYEKIRSLTNPSVPIYVDLSTRIDHIAPVSTKIEEDDTGRWRIVHQWLTGMSVKVYPPSTSLFPD